MNDASLKRAEITSENTDKPSIKKNRAAFFGYVHQQDITSFESELFNQISFVAEDVRVEYAEIKRLFKKKVSERTTEPSFEKDLVNCVEKIIFLFELSHILKRIQPYCEVVDGALLAPMEMALAKIRLSYGCDLSNPETWKLAQPMTNKITEDATHFDISKIKLSKLYGYIYDDMEWFVMSYKAANGENKRNFFSKLNEDSQLLAWTQPWIDLAEGKEVNWRATLSNAIESLSEEPLVTERRVYE